jgi:hypothetical protein
LLPQAQQKVQRFKLVQRQQLRIGQRQPFLVAQQGQFGRIERLEAVLIDGMKAREIMERLTRRVGRAPLIFSGFSNCSLTTASMAAAVARRSFSSAPRKFTND